MKIKETFKNYLSPLNLLIVSSFYLSLGVIIICYIWLNNYKWTEITNAILLSYVAGLIIYFITTYIPHVQKQKRAKDFLSFWVDAIIWQKDNFIGWKYQDLYPGEEGNTDSELFTEEHIYPTKQDCKDIFEIILHESDEPQFGGSFDSNYKSPGKHTKIYLEKLLIVKENFLELDDILFRLMTCNYMNKLDNGQPMDNTSFRSVKHLILDIYIDDFHEFCCIVRELEDYKTHI